MIGIGQVARRKPSRLRFDVVSGWGKIKCDRCKIKLYQLKAICGLSLCEVCLRSLIEYVISSEFEGPIANIIKD